MLHAFSGRILADVYQFFMHDSDADVIEEMPEGYGADDEFNRIRFIGIETFLRVGTRNHLHNYWVDVYHADSAPDFVDSERVFVVEFRVPSGTIFFQAPSDIEPTVAGDLPAGDYARFVIAYNLGVDDFLLGALMSGNR